MKVSVSFIGVFTLFMAGFLPSVVQVAAVEEFDLNYVGSCMHSEIGASAVRGNHAYSVTPHGLLVIDISDPTNPTPVSETYVPGQTYVAQRELDPVIILKDECAYIMGVRKLTIMNIASIHAPYVVSVYDYSGDCGGVAFDMELAGNKLYICGDSGMSIVDISDPANPCRLGKHQQPLCNGLAVKDPLVYIATMYNGLIILDVSGPAAISEVGRYEYNGNEIEIVDTIAYVLADQLHILNIADPVHPVEIGQYDSGEQGAYFLSLAISDNLAYMNAPWHGIYIVDISDPAAPELNSFVNDYFGTMHIEVIDSLALLSGYAWGLTLLNISNSTEPAVLGQYRPPYFGEDIVIKGNYVYSIVSDRLRAVNVSRPHSPFLSGSCTLNTYAINMALADTLIYLNCERGLNVVSISDPGSPVLADSIVYTSDTVCLSGGVTADDSYVYWAGSRFRIFDLSDPSPVSITGYLELSCPYSVITVSGNYAYVLSMYVLDISEPTVPEIAFHQYFYELNDIIPNALEVRLPYLYGVGYEGFSETPRLFVINIEDPYNPAVLTVLYDVDVGADMRMIGDSMYVVGTNRYFGQEMHIFDISDPASPQPVATADFGGEAFEIIGDTFFFASRSGFIIATASSVTCGDINGDEVIDAGDVVWLINYIFKGGPEPLESGDLDGNGRVSITDAVYLIHYLFGDGPAPDCG